MVEPRYDQFSLEGAFSAKRETVEISDVVEREEVSLWPFRKVLERTPVIGAGGYDASSARKAVEEGGLISLSSMFLFRIRWDEDT